MRTDFDADASGSREGSVSPSTRKRKKVNQRRKSLAETSNLLGKSVENLKHLIVNHKNIIDTNFMKSLSQYLSIIDNHDQHSNSSTHSNNQQSTTTSAPSNNLSVTNNKKTEQEGSHDHNDNDDEDIIHTTKRSKHDEPDNKQESELMVEPKNEYDDEDDADENVEDLTMDDEMLEDLEQAGPSHGGEGSSQGNELYFSCWSL